MLSRLDAASASQRQFVADASHELRSPLATIRAVHEIAALHPGTQDWDEANREVLGELDRVDRLVADLVLLARADERGTLAREQPMPAVGRAEAANERETTPDAGRRWKVSSQVRGRSQAPSRWASPTRN
ncbi:histidine kinase dimerization/phospho-acceptor domain-containing protein [Nocardioides sp. Root122]